MSVDQKDIDLARAKDGARGLERSHSDMANSAWHGRPLFASGSCMKFTCLNRDVKCEECMKFSEFMEAT